MENVPPRKVAITFLEAFKFPALFGSGVDSNYPVLYQHPKNLSGSG
jgi:hypothetical protein